MLRLKISCVLAAGVAVATPLSLTPSRADAALRCEASAVRGTVLGQTIEPVTANKGQAACRTATAGAADVLPAPLLTSALGAATSISGVAGTKQGQLATATGGLASLAVGLPDPIVQALTQVRQQVVAQALQNVPALTVPGVGTVDLNAAVTTLLTPINGELLRLTGSVAYARAECANGSPSLTGSAQVAGLRVLGQELPTDRAVQQTLNAVGAQTIDLSQLDVSQLTVAGVDLTPLQETLVRPLLSSLPAITIPEQVLSVRATPAEQVKTATSLTQRALQVQLSLAGQPVLDLVLGEATTGATADACATPSTQSSVASAALQCTTRRLVLIDVLERGGRVRLVGAADKRYVGRRVPIIFKGTGRRVARPKVRKDGTFRATAPLPARKLRDTNRARYVAKLGFNESLPLKLRRRMIVSGVRVSGGKVRIRGYIRKPLASPPRPITVKRRVSCSKAVTVGKVEPTRSGRFSITVKAPRKAQAGTYRLSTWVRRRPDKPRLYPTFTLPRFVDLARS